MVLAGAGGHARELYDVILHTMLKEKIVAFEEIRNTPSKKWPVEIKLINSKSEMKKFISKKADFTLATGNPFLRERFFNFFIEIGGTPHSVIANTAIISTENVILGQGLNIMHFVFISNNCKIGNGVLLNTGCRIHHDCTVGNFCEISPNVTLTGGCSIGTNSSIGTSATVLPGIVIGNNVTVAAGAVVTKNVRDNEIVGGIPASTLIKRVL